MQEQEALLEEYADYFAACEETAQFFRDHRMVDPKATPESLAVNWTTARSYRTYLVVVHLCKCGYGLQAAMLNRTLFEDMISAHWAIKHPKAAATRMAEHDAYTATLRAEGYEKHGMNKPRGENLPTYTKKQRERLDRRYRRGASGWTGKSVPAMVGFIGFIVGEASGRPTGDLDDVRVLGAAAGRTSDGGCASTRSTADP